jgi:NADPH-dependent 2,4-dienoyl-CoA reductase/sulfur reductase-like enzyme
VSAIDADTGRVRLTDGTEIDADVVLVALGVRPSTGWLAGSSVEVGDGVLCDATGRTSTPGIWAAGDVSSWWSDRAGRHRRIEHWTTAAEQARTVGANLAGGEPQPLDEVPYFWSDQFDLKLQSLGTPSGDDDVTLFRVGPRERLLAVYGRDGAVTGVVGFGVPKFVMRMRPLLAAAAPYEQALELAQTT